MTLKTEKTIIAVVGALLTGWIIGLNAWLSVLPPCMEEDGSGQPACIWTDPDTNHQWLNAYGHSWEITPW